MPEKAVYSLTDAGEKEFEKLMLEIAQKPVRIFLDFNAVIVNLEQLSSEKRNICLNDIEEQVNILKSYIENTFEVLKKETARGVKNKIVYSQDGKHLVFNTNLLDKFFHDILIVVEVRKQKDGSELLMNPRRVKKELELRKLGFAKDVHPNQPQFFEKVEEVIYQPTWTIDKDFDKFTHIIEERRQRFPIEMQSASSDELGRKLDDAITFAVAIAQRNYKFIVPMYRPQTGKIQLLMPIYLKGTYSSKPDFALILTPDKENEYYIPETILPLDAVYQNARLIAKPDDTWLNPDTIL